MNLIETGDHQVNADSDPDLRADSVLAGSVKSFNTQILLYPLKEELNLPAAFVDGGNGQSRKVEIVRKKGQPFARFRIYETDTSQSLRVIPLAFGRAQSNDLITSQAGGSIHWPGFEDIELGVLFASDDEECLCGMDAKQTPEIKVCTVEYINTTSFESDLVEEMHIVNQTVCNPYENWDWPMRSIWVCSLIALFALRKVAHGNIERHRSMVEESTA